MPVRQTLAAFVLTTAGLAAGLTASAPALGQETPVAVAARLADDGDAAKLVFDLSGPVAAKARALVDPDRIVVDMPEVSFQIDPSIGRPRDHAQTIVKGFRFGLFGPGRSRVVIDLAAPACIGKVETSPIVKGSPPSRLAVELKRCEPSAFAAAATRDAQGAAGAAPAVAASAAAPAADRPVIVLDPGHGGVDGGAFGVGGATEKSLVYDYTLELQRLLEAKGRFKVVLTRHGDEFVSLDDRVRIAREAGASLLVSIHADMLGGGGAYVSGATVYTCSERASDAEAARVAAHENAADKAAGVEDKAQAPGVADILFDLEKRETRAYAHLFSRGVVAELQGKTPLNNNPERSAGFVVLKAPDFPSVLVELGYLSNAKDVQAMKSPEWRTRTASAMVEAVDRFFASGRAAAAPAGADALAASDRTGANAANRPATAGAPPVEPAKP
jgi:N-acetylmuramoyl-L-alanine amidase